MTKLSQSPRGTRQSALIFGPPKTGKTQLVGGLSATHNLIWFDLENGHATLFQLPESQQERIELITLPDTRSYPIAIETCLKVIKGGPVSICESHGKVDCATCKKSVAPVNSIHLNALDSDTIVVFDSLTQLTNSAISHITQGKPDDYKLDYSDWGNLGKLMDIFLSHVQQAKFNVVCISHETEVEMEDGKMKIVPTAGTKNFSRNTAKYFSHVVYAEVRSMKHRFTSSTTATVNIVAGSRTGVTLEKMNEPSLAEIFKSQPVEERMDGVAAGTAVSNIASPVPGATDDHRKSANIQPTNGEHAASKLSGLAARLAAKRTGV
jgi:AAA domain